MAHFGKRALELLGEVLQHGPLTLPTFNEELLRQVLNEAADLQSASDQVISLVKNQETLKNQTSEEVGTTGDLNIDWEEYSGESDAVVFHHEAIKRNKRVLLTFLNERQKRIKNLRWRRPHLPPEIKEDLAPQEFQFFREYDNILRKYMKAIKLDLTTDLLPPKSTNVEVRVLKEHRDVVFSVGKVLLAKGSMHYLPREEVEPLVREGILEANLDLGYEH